MYDPSTKASRIGWLIVRRYENVRSLLWRVDVVLRLIIVVEPSPTSGFPPKRAGPGSAAVVTARTPQIRTNIIITSQASFPSAPDRSMIVPSGVAEE